MLASHKIYVKVSTKVKLGDRGGCSGDKSGVSLDRVSEGGGGGVRGWGRALYFVFKIDIFP